MIEKNIIKRINIFGKNLWISGIILFLLLLISNYPNVILDLKFIIVILFGSIGRGLMDF